MEELLNKARRFTGVVDMMKQYGRDSSLESRKRLGAAYGINNVGTAEGNELLKHYFQIGANRGIKAAGIKTMVEDRKLQESNNVMNGVTGGSFAPAPNQPYNQYTSPERSTTGNPSIQKMSLDEIVNNMFGSKT